MTQSRSLSQQLDLYLAQSRDKVPGPIAIGQLKETVRYWTRRSITFKPVPIARKLRLDNVAATLVYGNPSDIPLRELRFALFNLRDDPAFRSSTIARHRLVSEAMERSSRMMRNILFKAFFYTFEPQSPETERIYQYLCQHADSLRLSSREFVKRTAFAKGGYGIPALVKQVDFNDPGHSLGAAGMKEFMYDTPYGLEIKCTLMRVALRLVNKDTRPLKSVLGWIELGERQRADLESAYYHILLSPFVSEDPSPEVKRIISQFLLGHFNDPRSFNWPKLKGDTGRLKRDACIAVMIRWLDSNSGR